MSHGGAGAESPWVAVLAPAKVNPFLEVLARRADGYHELETTLLALELADRVEARATRTGGLELELAGPFASPDVPFDRRNLAWAAAEAVLAFAREERGPAAGLQVRLTKNVPSQAGLGGGSSDAAAALLAAEEALGLRLPEERARAVLVALGSDCVFFRVAAATGHARATGRGERVEVLEAAPRELALVVVTPNCGASTGAVYRALGTPLRNGQPPRSLPDEVRRLALPPSGPLAFNRLEEAALAAVPELRPWRALLDDVEPARFTLAGSGSSFFALYPAVEAAERCRAALARRAEGAGLALRGLWVTRPARHGALRVG